MIIIGGSASQSLSRSLAEVTNSKLAKAEIKRFPDEECYVRIDEDLSGKEVVIVQTAYPDHNIVELLLLMDAVREFDVKKLTVVVPYFGYSRQDKKFRHGEAISARAVGEHILMKADKMITVDIHNPNIFQYFSGEVRNVTGMSALGEYLKDWGAEVVLSPDEGSKDRASTAAEVIGVPWDFLEKTRIDGSTVRMKPKSLDVSGKKVAIVDDIIATGGTIVKAAAHLKRQGAVEIAAACTHGLFTSGALPKLSAACDEIVSSDTLERGSSRVTVARSVATAL